MAHQKKPHGILTSGIDRYKRSFLTSVASAISKLIAMALLVVSIPWTLPYLGTERFGFWMTISSLTAALAFLDFGVGYSLLNSVSRAKNRKSELHVGAVVTNGLCLLTLLAMVLATCMLAIHKLVDWAKIFNLSSGLTQQEANLSITLFICIFCISLPLKATVHIFTGMQEGYIPHSLMAVGNALALILLAALSQREAELPWLIMATYGVQTASLVVAMFVLLKRDFFKLSYTSLTPLLDFSKKIIPTAAPFFYLQLGALFAWGMDSVLIGVRLGLDAVAVFVVGQRLFQFVSQPLAFLISPLWGAYADAINDRDHAFVKKTLKTSILVCLLFGTISSLVLYLGSSYLVELVAESSVTLPLGLIIGLAIWSVLESVGNAFAMFLNAAAILKEQVILVTAFIVICFPAKWILLPIYGLDGFVFITIAAYVLTIAMPYLTVFRPAWMAVLTPLSDGYKKND